MRKLLKSSNWAQIEVALLAFVFMALALNGCKRKNTKLSSSDTSRAGRLVEWADLQVGDIFRISPSEDAGLCYLSGTLGLSKQVCGPFGLWQVKSHPLESSSDGAYFKKVVSIEDSSCLMITTLNNTLGQVSTGFCEDNVDSQIIKYGKDGLESKAGQLANIGALSFFTEYDNSDTPDGLRLGKFQGSTEGVAERTHVHDERMPIISEIAVVESAIIPRTISAIELVHHDLTPGQELKPIVEIMGFCDAKADGRCKTPDNRREKINVFDKGENPDERIEYFTDIAVKYLNEDGTGPLVGLKAFHVDFNNEEDEPFEVNLLTDSFIPSSPKKTSFVSEEGYEDKDKKALCEDGVMLGMDCNQDNCGDISLYCSKAVGTKDQYWIGHLISDQNDSRLNIKFGETTCGEGEAITGIECHSGSWCDNLKIRCAKVDGFEPQEDKCSWTETISEEQPNRDGIWYGPEAGLEGSQYLITGLSCDKGSYCDNKRLKVCKLPDDFRQKGSDWVRLKGNSESPDVENLEPLVGLSVRFTHPDLTRTTIERRCKSNSCSSGPRPAPHGGWQARDVYEVISFGGSIAGVAGVYAAMDENDYGPFSTFQGMALGDQEVPIIQSQSQSIGVFGANNEFDEVGSLMMSLQMFRFSTPFADHEQLFSFSDSGVEANTPTNNFLKLKTIELCAKSISASNPGVILGLKVIDETGSSYSMGNTTVCSNENGNSWFTHTIESPIVEMQWKPVQIQGKRQIRALKLNFKDEGSLEFDANAGEVCIQQGIGSGHYGAGQVLTKCEDHSQDEWKPAFAKLDGYCINGFQGISNTPQKIGSARGSTYSGGSYFQSISEKFTSAGIKGLASLSPIYLSENYCQ